MVCTGATEGMTTKDSPEKGHWHVRDVVLATLVYFAVVVPLSLLLGSSGVSDPKGYLIASEINVLAYVLVTYLLRGKYPLKILHIPYTSLFIQYVFIGTLACIFLNFPNKIWGGNFDNIPKQYTFFVEYSFFDKVVFLSVLCLIGPILEEILFRGFIYRILSQRFDIFWGALGSTVLFALGHNLPLRGIVIVAITGLVYCYVYEKTQSILTSIIVHSLNNTLWFGVVYWGIKRHASI